MADEDTQIKFLAWEINGQGPSVFTGIAQLCQNPKSSYEGTKQSMWYEAWLEATSVGGGAGGAVGITVQLSSEQRERGRASGRPEVQFSSKHSPSEVGTGRECVGGMERRPG